MHHLDSFQIHRISRRSVSVILGGLTAGVPWWVCGDEAGRGSGIVLRPDPWPGLLTRVRYQSRVQGTLSTPAGAGKRDFSLEAQGDFDFVQRVAALPSGVSGYWRAARRFTKAISRTKVGSDHETSTDLPEGARRILVGSSDNHLLQFSADVRLTRPQLDLLQFPLDPLAVSGLLPLRVLGDRSERWNADNRTAALLAGLDAVISQTTVCSLEELTAERAVVRFSCEVTGAMTGSASAVKSSGTLLLDRRSGLLRSLRAVLEEKRSPGPISPGLDVRGEVVWSQEEFVGAGSEAALPQDLPESGPDSRLLLLTLSTPWQLLLIHDRDWHVFQQTPELMLLRRITNGALIAQCNLSRGPQLSAGQHSTQEEFLADVDRRVRERSGEIRASRVRANVNGWRIHHVRALGRVAAAENSAAGTAVSPGGTPAAAVEKTVFWDYYLCSAKTGEQYSLVFSHLEEDTAAFGDAAERMLSTLTLRSVRPRVPLPK
ncbi:MAG: hypothetical protein ACKO2P_20140 [Planctomycetota bacterium]